MNVQNVALKVVAGSIKQFPEDTLPEIAFVGKSNVGKSSLINSLLGRKSLARISSAPGKTRTINWYEVDEQLFFVDLPGYGYAKVSKAEQLKWGKVIETYLHKRESLKLVLLLVDVRHAPGEGDQMMMQWLQHYNVPTLVVATKSDKIKRSQHDKQKKIIREVLGISKNELLLYSSETKAGRDEVWQRILNMVQEPEVDDMTADSQENPDVD